MGWRMIALSKNEKYKYMHKIKVCVQPQRIATLQHFYTIFGAIWLQYCKKW